MELTWKYKIDISDPAVFDEIEKERQILFPDELKEFINAHTVNLVENTTDTEIPNQNVDANGNVIEG